MLLTPHILVGVAIIILVHNPILGLIFILASHYLLDLLPHAEYSINNIKSGQWKKSSPDFLWAFLDMTLGMIIVFLTVGFTPLILIAVFVAIFPDGLSILYGIFPSNKALIKHNKIHMAINSICENKKIPIFWGIVSQVLVMAIAIYLLLQPRILL